MVVEITLVMVLQDLIEKFPICKDKIFRFCDNNLGNPAPVAFSSSQPSTNENFPPSL